MREVIEFGIRGVEFLDDPVGEPGRLLGAGEHLVAARDVGLERPPDLLLDLLVRSGEGPVGRRLGSFAGAGLQNGEITERAYCDMFTH